jgi:hypothetical protein
LVIRVGRRTIAVAVQSKSIRKMNKQSCNESLLLGKDKNNFQRYLTLDIFVMTSLAAAPFGVSLTSDNPGNPREEPEHGNIIQEASRRWVASRLQRTLAKDVGQRLFGVEILLFPDNGDAAGGLAFPLHLSSRLGCWAVWFVSVVPEGEQFSLGSCHAVCVSRKERDEGVEILVVDTWFVAQEMLFPVLVK